MKKALILYIFLISASLSKAQGFLSNYKVESLQIGYGVLTSGPTFANQEDFKKMYPYSPLARIDIEGFSPSHLGNYNFKGIAKIGVEFSQKDWREKNRLIRIGFNASIYHSSITALSARYHKEETDLYRSYYDENGDQVFVDTTHFQNVEYVEKSKFNNLGLGITFNTNYDRRWSVFTGLKLLTGIQKGITYFTYNSGRMHQYYNQYGNEFDFNFDNNNNRGEVYHRGSSVLIGYSFPVSIQLRIAKTTPFFNRWRIILEKEFSTINYRVWDYGLYTKSFSTTMLGFKFDL